MVNTRKGGNAIMNYTVIVFLLCQCSSAILEQAKNTQKNIIETNGGKMSPKEKNRKERIIDCFGFFAKLLKYGSAVYFLLSLVLQIMVDLKM